MKLVSALHVSKGQLGPFLERACRSGHHSVLFLLIENFSSFSSFSG
jgi:hypothetical protein